MKLPVFPLVLALLFPFSVGAAGHDHHAAPATAAAQVPWAQGTIKKVDAKAGKATIAHGPIDSIGMGPMTMMFTVKDTTGLARLKAGDAVRFQAVMADGDIVVVRIEAAR
jgi:Cu/Ag efflux protein CusF